MQNYRAVGALGVFENRSPGGWGILMSTGRSAIGRWRTICRDDSIRRRDFIGDHDSVGNHNSVDGYRPGAGIF